MNYYSHNIGDYAQATMHLSLVEDAIYSRLLRRYYAEEQPIKDDLQQVCRWVGARTEEERAAVPMILQEFFELVDGAWRNKR
ncbi:YdaU family protein, partial [Serratia bockelmannii]